MRLPECTKCLIPGSRRSAEREVRSVGGQEAPLASPAGPKGNALQEPDYEGHDGSAIVSEWYVYSTMRSAHDTKPLHDDRSAERMSRRPETVHTTVPETALRHNSKDVSVSSSTVTRCDATPRK
jgi:hypothetical protein